MIYFLLLALPVIAVVLFLFILFRMTQIVPQRFMKAHPEELAKQHFNINWVLGATLFLAFFYALLTLMLQWIERTHFFGPTENQTLGSVVLMLLLLPLPMLPAFLLSSLVQSLAMKRVLKTSTIKESL